MARKKLGEMLVEAGVVDESSVRRALAEQKRWGGTLGRMLVELKYVSEVDLVRVLAHQLNVPTIDLDNINIHPSVLELVPGDLAQEISAVPFAQPMKFLDVAMADPTNLGAIDELRIRTQLNIRPYLAGPRMIERALANHYHVGFGRSTPRPDVAIPIDVGDVVEARPPIPVGPSRVPRGFSDAITPPSGSPVLSTPRDLEIDVLQTRISKLEALVARDEEVLRKLLALLVEKRVATREEILERIR